MFLLVYKGKCASTIVNGVKFTSVNGTANVDDEKAQLFMDSEGKSIYDDIEVVKIEKRDVVPEAPKELTVEGLKKDHKLEELQAMCAERELNTEGSKSELAEKIIAFEEEKKSVQE